jgi:Sortase domain
MRSVALIAAVLGLVLARMIAPAASAAAVPPNPNDPCGSAGHDACGTTGVGFYAASRYGVRWYGDFRGVAGPAQHLFCIDLRYWYASRGYGYRPATGTLRNRDGKPVSLANQQKLAYAIWTYGRSIRPKQQAAVMLYVHSLMGDARPGELEPSLLGSAVSTLFRRIARDAARYHGPYRIESKLPSTLVAGTRAEATVRVLSAEGAPVPHVRLTLSTNGTASTPSRVRTDASGVATVALTPTRASGVRLALSTEPLAPQRPRILSPTTGAAAANGQRLALPTSERVSTTLTAEVTASPRLATVVSAQEVVPGQEIHDRVMLTGLGTLRVRVQVELWGPFATRGEIACTGTPYWTGSFVAEGDGTYPTTPVRVDRAGYYSFRERIAPGASNIGFVAPCAETTETALARARPQLATTALPEVSRPGSSVSDRIQVQGLGRTTAEIEVELFGPFASRAAVRCSGRPFWQGRIEVEGDGLVRSPAVHLTRAGFYAFRERLVRSALVPEIRTPCGLVAETPLVAPRIVAGRGDTGRFVQAVSAGARTPVRIRVPGLGIDAPVSAAQIDVAHGVLGAPASIARTGWWRDGAAPGARHGAVLITGHVDSAKGGIGAFFQLRRAQPRERVEVVTSSGRTLAYDIVSVRSYRKGAVPTSIFSRRGAARLVLVTCGGPFDRASGHYRDNVVLTAVPA